MTLLTVTQLCSQADVERRHGAQAVVNWCDHDEDTVADTGVVDACINQASEEICLYLRTRYDLTGLAKSPIVMSWAVVFTAYFMSINRGNSPPDALAREYERITLLLQAIAAWQTQLPGIPMRADMRPSMSNIKIDRRYRDNKQRVEKDASTDQTTTLRENRANDGPTLYP